MTGNDEVKKSEDFKKESEAKERDEKMRVIWIYKLFANSSAFHSLTTLSFPTPYKNIIIILPSPFPIDNNPKPF